MNKPERQASAKPVPLRHRPTHRRVAHASAATSTIRTLHPQLVLFSNAVPSTLSVKSLSLAKRRDQPVAGLPIPAVELWRHASPRRPLGGINQCLVSSRDQSVRSFVKRDWTLGVRPHRETRYSEKCGFLLHSP